MTRREVEQRMRLVLVRELRCDPARVRDDAEFRAHLGADSLDIVTLTATIEEEFGVAITDDEAAFCETVGTAIDLVESKLENGGRHDRRRA